jgi:hypothetical protein
VADLDRARLKALAEKATQGPWKSHKSFPANVCVESDAQKPMGGADTPEVDRGYAEPIATVQFDDFKFDGWEKFTHRRQSREQAHADAAYIAACSPDVILSLLATLEQIEQWAKSPPSNPEYWTYTELAMVGRSKAEVLRLLREEAK